MSLDQIDEDDITAFLVESYENLNSIERDIVDLEKTSTNGEILERIYRAIHSIKGNCGFLPFAKLEAIAHTTENILGCLRDGKLEPNHSIISALLESVDTIRQLLNNIEASSNEGDIDCSTLIKTLAQLGAGDLGLGARDEEGQRGRGGHLRGRVSRLEQSVRRAEEDTCVGGFPTRVPSSGGTPPTDSLDLSKVSVGQRGEIIIQNPIPPTPLNKGGSKIQNYPASSPSTSRPPTASSPSASPSSIRVNVDLLDNVMNLVGELVLARNQLLQLAANVEDNTFNATCQQLNAIANELHTRVMKTRMQPVSTIWQKFPRVVRDLASSSGKQVQVTMTGTETELDKSIIEAIKDPLTHIIRNCIDHGIETPTVRTQRGKPVVGSLRLRAFHQSGKVNIEISDDGSGIDPEQIKHKAQQLGLITPTTAASISESEAVNLIFLPGLSTAQQVTNLSGRGVGMDVVKTNIEKINGTVDVDSQLGEGTKFKIKIPLTLAIIPGLIVMSGSDRYAIPQLSILELIRLESQAHKCIEMLYDVPVYRWRGNILPLVYLNRELQRQDTTQQETINIVAIDASDYQYGLVVDSIEDTQDIVVKPLGKQLKDLTAFAGATVLGDGKVALIIDAIALAQQAGMTRFSQSSIPPKDQPEDNRQMVLLFHAGQAAPMGILLTYAFRLEEFPLQAVEKIGNQYVVQYRGKILSLIDLNTIFGIADDQPDNKLISQRQISQAEDETIEVVVISLHEQSFGLVVERILDIVEEPLTVQGTATRPGVLFLALIQGKITEILDVENLVRIANPYLFKDKE